MIKNDEVQQNQNEKEEQQMPVYNTYNERGHINIGALVLTIIAIVTLCCVPFNIQYGNPTPFISDITGDGKLMLAILLTMVFFYILCFDMLAFCVAAVNVAFLGISIYDRQGFDALSGCYILFVCSVLILFVHFLYPYIAKKIRNRKKVTENR